MKSAAIFLLSLVCLNSYAQELGPVDTLQKEKALIRPPKNFTGADNFSGYLDFSTSSSIIVARAGGKPYEQYRQVFTPSYFESQKLTVAKKEDVTVSGLAGTLYYITFNVQDTPMQRLMLITGTGRDTWIVIGNYPAAFHQTLYPLVKKSILTFSVADL